MDNSDFDRTPERLRKEYEWAIKIIRKHFASGLEAICDKRFLDQRYEDFQRKHDPIYAELLDGMDDGALAKTFVSYWTIGQTVATQSRFWLEDAIAEIIIFQVKNLNRPATHVCSQAMLGLYFQRRVPIAQIGEQVLEHLSDRSPWEVPVQQSTLKAIDILIGEQERAPKPPRDGLHARQWSNERNSLAVSNDRDQLDHIALSLKGPPATSTRIQCNLLVIEPDKLDGETHAWGIRFINPTLFIYSKEVAGHPIGTGHSAITVSRDVPLPEQGTTLLKVIVTCEGKLGEHGKAQRYSFQIAADPNSSVGYKVIPGKSPGAQRWSWQSKLYRRFRSLFRGSRSKGHLR